MATDESITPMSSTRKITILGSSLALAVEIIIMTTATSDMKRLAQSLTVPSTCPLPRSGEEVSEIGSQLSPCIITAPNPFGV
jgi:hypothetical protein